MEETDEPFEVLQRGVGAILLVRGVNPLAPPCVDSKASCIAETLMRLTSVAPPLARQSAAG
eukprot:8268609-Pyramimonas_sp.AAC.1